MCSKTVKVQFIYRAIPKKSRNLEGLLSLKFWLFLGEMRNFVRKLYFVSPGREKVKRVVYISVKYIVHILASVRNLRGVRLEKQCFGFALVSMQIRIQHFRSMRTRMRIRIQIQGFDNQNLEKINS
jgi:hypothetical protein